MLKQDIAMIEVSIPSMEREVDESGKSTKVRKVFSLLSASFHVARCLKRCKIITLLSPFACLELRVYVELRRQVSKVKCRKTLLSSDFCPKVEICVWSTLYQEYLCRKYSGLISIQVGTACVNVRHAEALLDNKS